VRTADEICRGTALLSRGTDGRRSDGMLRIQRGNPTRQALIAAMKGKRQAVGRRIGGDPGFGFGMARRSCGKR